MIDGIEQRWPFFRCPAVAKYEIGISVRRLSVDVQDIFGGHLVHAGQRAGVIEGQIGGIDV
ncbi:hypothetical protein PSE10A_53340 [Pseudomonas amygdali pv. eriobotryae]|uniref:Uncharacterized protein n=1 Tax=Pseudomonas amygdali pv. eriobotryae TaxID=129137 RepID=A0A9P3AJR9_PSEA0|nr:hypothetical protein PSE10A_53340 [Pseudomonas amygdali pv. eriobotryae]